MKAFCTKCNINWAALHSQDVESYDETYFYCPKCASDMDLEAVRPGEQFMMSMFSGQIINARTGQAMVEQVPVSKLAPVIPFDKEAWEKKQTEKEDEEDARISEYIKVHDAQGKAAAEEIFFKRKNS